MANESQPGDRLIQAALTGQIDGTRLGQLAFQLLPALPFEAGFPFPRVLTMARAAVAPQPVIPPTQPAAVVPPAAPVVQAPQLAAVVIPSARGMQFRSPVVTGISHPTRLSGM